MTPPGRPRALHVVFYGGIAAASLDIVNAIVFWQVHSSTPATRILLVHLVLFGLLLSLVARWSANRR